MMWMTDIIHASKIIVFYNQFQNVLGQMSKNTCDLNFNKRQPTIPCCVPFLVRFDVYWYLNWKATFVRLK